MIEKTPTGKIIMARVEADREDLLKEAVALVRRMEFQPIDSEESIIVGFRQAGWLSVYFGPDRMYQFDDAGRLRRSYINGLLYRTQGTTLAQLQRQRSDTETALVRHDLDANALAEFRKQAVEKIRWLEGLLRADDFMVARRIPADDAKLTQDVLAFLEIVLNSPEFLAPPIRGKR